MTVMGGRGIVSEVTEMEQFVSAVEGGMETVQGERPWRQGRQIYRHPSLSRGLRCDGS